MVDRLPDLSVVRILVETVGLHGDKWPAGITGAIVGEWTATGPYLVDVSEHGPGPDDYRYDTVEVERSGLELVSLGPASNGVTYVFTRAGQSDEFKR